MHIFYFCFEKISQKGSANTHVIEVVENFAKRGHRVTLFLPRLDRQMQTMTTGRIEFVYVPVFNLRLMTWILYDLYSFVFLLKYAIRHRPDIVYFRETQSWVPLFFAKLIRCKIIIEVNGWVIDELKMVGYSRWKLKVLEVSQRFNFRHAHGIITVSPGITELARQTYRLKPHILTTIPNGTNPERFLPLDMTETKTRLKLEINRDYVGFLGSCYPYHGLENLINAAPLVLREIPEVRFIIAGEGVSRSYWQKLVSDLGLTEKFLFPGLIPTENAVDWINSFTICVAPWHKVYMDDIGVSPLKLFDYMACGRPVAVSHIKGVTEIVEAHRCGFAIDVENPEIFAEHLLILLRDRNLRESMGKRGREGILRDHTWQITKQKILHFIDRIQDV
ncbi:MAG: glycosyltransferase family 4 protein [Candidatus Neomarinimicrobiota bacterium]